MVPRRGPFLASLVRAGLNLHFFLGALSSFFSILRFLFHVFELKLDRAEAPTKSSVSWESSLCDCMQFRQCVRKDVFEDYQYALHNRIHLPTLEYKHGTWLAMRRPRCRGRRMVPRRGLEPPRDCSHQLLRLACLPFHHLGMPRE